MKFQTLHVHSSRMNFNVELVLLTIPLIVFALTVFTILSYSPIRNPQVEAAHTEVTP